MSAEYQPVIDALTTEAGQCRNDGADDVAVTLESGADAIFQLTGKLTNAQWNEKYWKDQAEHFMARCAEQGTSIADLQRELGECVAELVELRKSK